MARLKINITGNTIATVSIPVRITDLNYGNHVGNDALVSIVHEARVQWLRSHGYTELNVAGAGLIMSDLAVEYKKEGFYGDVFQISLSADDISRVGFDLYYSISNQKNELIAKVKTGMVCYDYTSKKVTEIPAAFKALLLQPA